MPCARHEDSVPLVAVAEEACRGNPLFRCFEFFGATLPFESNRAIAKSLHAGGGPGCGWAAFTSTHLGTGEWE